MHSKVARRHQNAQKMTVFWAFGKCQHKRHWKRVRIPVQFLTPQSVNSTCRRNFDFYAVAVHLLFFIFWFPGGSDVTRCLQCPHCLNPTTCGFLSCRSPTMHCSQPNMTSLWCLWRKRADTLSATRLQLWEICIFLIDKINLWLRTSESWARDFIQIACKFQLIVKRTRVQDKQ